MQNDSCRDIKQRLEPDLRSLVEVVVNAVIRAYQTQSWEDAFRIRDELHRLPDYLMTDVLNDIILKLVMIDPDLCRWFILDVFLQGANPEGKADVAERINLLLADLRSQSADR